MLPQVGEDCQSLWPGGPVVEVEKGGPNCCIGGEGSKAAVDIP